MKACNHKKLVLLPSSPKRLRCRHCHLTIRADELGNDCCPECFERSGDRRYEFEEMEAAAGPAQYRCETCGALIET